MDLRQDWRTPVDIPEGERGEYKIRHVHWPAGQVARLVSNRTALFSGAPEITSVKFAGPTRWHELTQGGGVWTTDYPIERYQQEKLIQNFSGRVLVTGLGVGMIARLLSLKPKVTNVVIVERSQEVIDLVAPYICDAKVSVVKMDAFDYLETTDDKFDYAFHDIWQGDGENTLVKMVLPLRKLTHRVLYAKVQRLTSSGRHVACWNEDVMLGQIRHFLELHTKLDMDTEHLLDDVSDTMKRAFGPIPLDVVDDPELSPGLTSVWVTRNFWRWYWRKKDMIRWLSSQLGADRRKAILAYHIDLYLCDMGSPRWEQRWGKLELPSRFDEDEDEQEVAS